MQKTSPKVSDVRTQIYLPKHLYAAVKKKAQSRDVSMATVIREAVEARVAEPTPEYRAAKNDLLEVAGILKDEPKDMSVNISKYVQEVYRKKKI